MELQIESLPAGFPGQVEIVERKGLGHPDTICDALAERLSCGLSRFYLEHFGEVLHHNVDKALLIGGRARAAFGGGEVLAPIEIHLAGRAVSRVGEVEVPVQQLAIEQSRAWLQENLRNLDVARDVRLHVHLRPGSADLRELFERGKAAVPIANDTSFGVGHAPLSRLERITWELERELNSSAFRDRHPAGGEDVKLLAARQGERVDVTLARAFVGAHLPNLDAYLEAKAQLATHVTGRVSEHFANAGVVVNASDHPSSGSVYLTVTGTSAEAGDDGEVGRGNRVNGLITPYRPMSLEAAAGKNSVSHTGKLYNLAARETAEMLCRELAKDVVYAEVFLLSEIGRPVTTPKLSHVRLELAEPGRLDTLRPQVRAILAAQLSGISGLFRRVISGELCVY